MQSFSDPILTSDGKPYRAIKYRNIVQERYVIAKNCNTSYTDLGNITPIERQYLLEFILDDAQKKQQLIEEKKRSMGK